MTAPLSTLNARHAGISLWECIDVAEADRTNGVAAPRPKRSRPKPTKAAGEVRVKPPTRAKRIEQAALGLAAIDIERLPREARQAFATLRDALGVKIPAMERAP